MRHAKLLSIVLAAGMLVGAAAPSAAHEKKARPHHGDFYATTNELDARVNRPDPASAGCFVTLTAAEATKGIRHFRPNC